MRSSPRLAGAAALVALLSSACQSGHSTPDGGGGDAASAIDAPPPVIDAEPPDADLRALPDITVGADRLRVDLAVDQHTYAGDSCELDPMEDCILAPGDRTLLRFAVETPNIGNADLFLGSPNPSNPNFQYSSCHGHYHFVGYANFQLVDADDQVAAVGHKQAFCLLDSERYLDDPDVATAEKYWCGYQGIQRGWSDVYHTRLACQFIDITGVPDGDYTLRISLNQNHTLEELDYDNNVVDVPVTIGDPALAGPTEDCPADLGAHATTGSHRECGWTLQQSFDCTPGATIRVGCSDCSNLGTCTGDPMIRVCDPAHPGGNCTDASAIGSNDDACSLCPRANNLRCPASGQVDVYVGAAVLGEAYTCNLAIL